MTIQVILGCQWGDEGKGKVIDFLTEKATMVVRFQGGNNAGHTIYKGKDRVVLHQIPSGVLSDKTKLVIGNGTVVNPKVLLGEIRNLEALGVSFKNRLFISGSAHIILPYHIALDSAQEENLLKNKIGTTQRGIGPCYQAKIGRMGIRFVDFLHPASLKQKFAASADYHLRLLKALGKDGDALLSADKMLAELEADIELLKPYITDTQSLILQHAAESGSAVLLEGAQGSFLDIDHGSYPYVTSSNTSIGGAITGTGLPHTKIEAVIGVCKAYATRVGEGPFPTELMDQQGQILRDLGHEYGSTTGRPRRCGWLDLVMLRYAVELNGVSQLTLTKLDVLDSCAEIKVAVAYEQNGKRLDHYPLDLHNLKPIYRSFPGWKQQTSPAKQWQDLPEEARSFIEGIEKEIGKQITMISTGPLRENTILR